MYLLSFSFSFCTVMKSNLTFSHLQSVFSALFTVCETSFYFLAKYEISAYDQLNLGGGGWTFT